MEEANHKTILIVDDELNIRETLQDLLEIQGYNTLVAPDGEAAMFMAVRELPDLIISDVMMPKMDGYELLEVIRSYKKTRYIPFLMLTAKSESEFMRKGMSKGADDYIVKPFEQSDLLASVQYRLAHHKALVEETKHKELKRIKMDLHDNLQQTLLGSKIMAKKIKSQVGDQENLQKDVNTLITNLDLSFIHLRNLLDGNPTERLEILGFRETLAQLVNSFKSYSNMEVEFEDGWDIEIPVPVAEQIIPALSEILSNIIKHSQATKISFMLSQQSNKYIIVITDNGVGMDLKVHQKSRGLSNIKDRLNHVGTYVLESEPENGTRYAITVDV
ncbi:MAG: response regulator [Cyclobacteriaceae bacterium]